MLFRSCAVTVRDDGAGADPQAPTHGLGLLLGIDPERDCGTVINECLEEGVLVLSAHGKVRLLPALNIPLDQLDQALAVLVEVLGR